MAAGIINGLITAFMAGCIGLVVGWLYGRVSAVQGADMPWPKVFPMPEALPRELEADEVRQLALALGIEEEPVLLNAFANAAVRLARAKAPIIQLPVFDPAHSGVGSTSALAAMERAEKSRMEITARH